MPKTNPIGSGTANVSINAPAEWALELGRLACASGQSRGKFVRSLVERGLEATDPARAQKLRQIRRQYYGAALLVIFSLGLFATHFPMAMREARCEFELEETTV